MSNPTLNLLLKDYEQKKYKADLNFEKDKTAFYNSKPELLELNKKLGNLALDISKAVLNNNPILEKNLRKEFDDLKKSKDELLKSIDIPKRCYQTSV